MPEFDPISPTEFPGSEGVEGWRILGEGVLAFFPTSSFAASAALVGAIAGLEGVAGHAPAVDIRAIGVTVRLISVRHDWFGPSRQDARLAAAISALAGELGLRSEPGALQSPLVIPGALDIAAITPFWKGGPRLRAPPRQPGGGPRGPGRPRARVLVRGDGRAPRRRQGQHPHLVWLPPELALARIAAALAAGGTLVSDAAAPSWWTLADPAGNELCISSIAERD